MQCKPQNLLKACVHAGALYSIVESEEISYSCAAASLAIYHDIFASPSVISELARVEKECNETGFAYRCLLYLWMYRLGFKRLYYLSDHVNSDMKLRESEVKLIKEEFISISQDPSQVPSMEQLLMDWNLPFGFNPQGTGCLKLSKEQAV